MYRLAWSFLHIPGCFLVQRGVRADELRPEEQLVARQYALCNDNGRDVPSSGFMSSCGGCSTTTHQLSHVASEQHNRHLSATPQTLSSTALPGSNMAFSR